MVGEALGGSCSCKLRLNTSNEVISNVFDRILFGFVAYFGLGAYYNYNNYGATGWDLVP